VCGGAGVHDDATGAGREAVVDSGGDADAAEVGVGADHDLLHALGGLPDQVEDRLWRLAVAPDHGDGGVAVTDGLGGLPVLDDEQDPGAGGGREGDGLVGGKPDVVRARPAVPVQGAAVVVRADRAADADVGVAVDAEDCECFWFKPGVDEQSGQVLAGFGVTGVVLDERARSVVAAAGEEVLAGADDPLQPGLRRGAVQGSGGSRPFPGEQVSEFPGPVAQCLQGGLPGLPPGGVAGGEAGVGTQLRGGWQIVPFR
jgi:hypothetical protein